MVIDKTFAEMTKQELYKRIRYNNRELRKIANGTAWLSDMENYNGYYYYHDDTRAALKEIWERGNIGYTALENQIHEAAYNQAWKTAKVLEKKLGY